MPLAPVYVPHPKNDADVMAAARLIPLTAKNYDVEMCDEACVPEADLVDIEMEDDFLPLIVVSIFLSNMVMGQLEFASFCS